LPHRCQVPSVRAPGQDFHLRSQHPYSAHQARPSGPSPDRIAVIGPVTRRLLPLGSCRSSVATLAGFPTFRTGAKSGVRTHWSRLTRACDVAPTGWSTSVRPQTR
jgi:hypothetical protein